MGWKTQDFPWSWKWFTNYILMQKQVRKDSLRKMMWKSRKYTQREGKQMPYYTLQNLLKQRKAKESQKNPNHLTWRSFRGKVMWQREACCCPRGSSGVVGRGGRLREEHTITRISWWTPLVAYPSKATSPTTIIAVVSEAWVVGWGSQHGVRRRAGMAGVMWEVERGVVGYTSWGFRCWPLLCHRAWH